MHVPFVRRFAVAAAMSLVLAACAGGGDDPVDAVQADASQDHGVEIEDGTPAEIYAQLAELDPEVREQVIREGAAEEGAVMLYTATPVDLAEEWQLRFQEQYPEVNMQFVRGSSGELLERFPAEERSGNHIVDVLRPGGVNGPEFADQGLLAEHHGLPVPDWYPDELWGDWWIVGAASPFVIAWNTNLVDPEEAPRSHEDLLDPRWRGQVAVEAAPEAWIAGLIDEWGLEETEDFLRALVIDQEAEIRSGHTNTMQLLAAGEFPVAAELFAHFIEDIRAEGAPIDWTTGGFAPASGSDIVISANAPNPYSALLLVNFMVEYEGAEAWVEAVGNPVFHPEVDYVSDRIGDLVQGDDMKMVDPHDLLELGRQARTLVEEIITPRFTE